MGIMKENAETAFAVTGFWNTTQHNSISLSVETSREVMLNSRSQERKKNIREKERCMAWGKKHSILKRDENLFPFCTIFILDLLQFYSNMHENHYQELDFNVEYLKQPYPHLFVS